MQLKQYCQSNRAEQLQQISIQQLKQNYMNDAVPSTEAIHRHCWRWPHRLLSQTQLLQALKQCWFVHMYSAVNKHRDLLNVVLTYHVSKEVHG